MVRRFLPVLLLILAAAPFISAENSFTVNMELYNTVLRSRETDWTDPLNPVVGDSYWAYGFAGKAALSFEPKRNRNVKADLALDFNFPDLSGIPVITLQKAYVKARFPSFRLTAGKTRLGWGDGFVFNSGDVVFGSISPDVSLVGSEIRTDTAWLTSFNVPLGRFSFVEALIKAPDMIYSGTTPVGLGKAEDLGAGGRIYTKLGGIKLEAGYFFDGTDIVDYDLSHTVAVESYDIDCFHRPYFSIQGNLGADFYLSSSVALPGNYGDILAETAQYTWNISFGLFHLIEVGYDNSLTLRLESVFLPFRDWKEDEGVSGSYAVLLYPEIAFAYGQSMNFSVRSIFSPIDLSAMITGGFSWNIFEGFNLLAYANFLAGDGNDTFSWSKDIWVPGVDSVDGVSFLAGVQYIY